jgi:hypothetical protein
MGSAENEFNSLAQRLIGTLEGRRTDLCSRLTYCLNSMGSRLTGCRAYRPRGIIGLTFDEEMP